MGRNGNNFAGVYFILSFPRSTRLGSSLCCAFRVFLCLCSCVCVGVFCLDFPPPSLQPLFTRRFSFFVSQNVTKIFLPSAKWQRSTPHPRGRTAALRSWKLVAPSRVRSARCGEKGVYTVELHARSFLTLFTVFPFSLVFFSLLFKLVKLREKTRLVEHDAFVLLLCRSLFLSSHPPPWHRNLK